MESLLDEKMVKSLAYQKGELYLNRTNKVIFIAASGNWGPPISGRFDTDFFDLWAAAAADDKGAVVLQGARNGVWNIQSPFQLAEKTEQFNLYKIHLPGQYDYPDEFVIRFDTEEGPFYDNNNGQNYRIKAWGGYFASAALVDRYIVDFGDIHSVRLYNKG